MLVIYITLCERARGKVIGVFIAYLVHTKNVSLEIYA